MHSRPLIVGTALALALLVGALLLTESPDSASAVEVVPTTRMPIAAANPSLSLTPPTHHASESVVASTRAPARSSVMPELKDRTARAADRKSGNLWIRGVDGLSGEELPSIRVRAVSTTRIADRTESRDGEITLRLTPDGYSVLVLSPGYEPLELPFVDLRWHVDAEPRVAALRPGSARVAARVLGSLPALSGFDAELIGPGRRPCVRCADSSAEGANAQVRAWMRGTPCAACGFARDASRKSVAPDGAVSFDALASGTYGLRLVDPAGQRDCDVLWIEVRDSQALEVELVVPTRRSVLVEIRDVDGVSLAPYWSRRLARSDFGVTGELPGCVWTCAFRDDDRPVARCEFVSPPNAMERPSSFGGRRFGSGRKSDVEDRQRSNGDLLYPKPKNPTIAPLDVPCELRGDGLVMVRDLPACALTLKLACVGFQATVMIPASDVEARVEALLEEREEGAIGRSPVSSPVDVPVTFRAQEAASLRR